MTSQEIDTALDQLSTTAAEESIASIDHAVNAKAIAVRDETVRERLAATLSDHYKLKSITPLTGHGTTPMDFRLMFHFESEALIDLPVRDFVVSVELPTKSVKRIIDKPEEMKPLTVTAPFSLAVPSRAQEYKTPISEVATRVSSERQFLSSLAPPGTISNLRREGFNVQPLSPCDTFFTTSTHTVSSTSLQTNVSSTTFSDGAADDEQNDLQPDFVDDGQEDLSGDVQDDCVPA